MFYKKPIFLDIEISLHVENSMIDGKLAKMLDNPEMKSTNPRILRHFTVNDVKETL